MSQTGTGLVVDAESQLEGVHREVQTILDVVKLNLDGTVVLPSEGAAFVLELFLIVVKVDLAVKRIESLLEIMYAAMRVPKSAPG